MTPTPPEGSPTSAPPLAADISTALDPWSGSSDEARLTLETSGETVVQGSRSFGLELENGPVIPAAPGLPDLLPVTGEATAVFSVTPRAGLAPDQLPQQVSVSTPFAALGGEPVGSVAFDDGTFPIGTQGPQVVRLESLFFDVPGIGGTAGTVTVCNGQTEGQPTAALDGVPTGTNPAVAPLPTNVQTEFVGAEARLVVVDDVTGQSVTSALRAGDTAAVRLLGLRSGADYTVGFGPTSGPCATTCESLVADASGTGSARLTVPQSMTPGATYIRVDGGADFIAIPIRVLGPAAVAATEEVGEDRLTVTLTGTDWDPEAEVVLRGLAGDAETTDAAVAADVDADGTFRATYSVTDVDATEVRATQPRADGLAPLSVTHSLENAVPQGPSVPPQDEEPPAEENLPGEQAPPGDTTAPSAPSVPSSPVAAPPVAIPLPDEVPVNDVDGLVPGADGGGGDLAITEARLDGAAGIAELFGGSSRREVAFVVENVGETLLSSPLVRLGVGRTDEADPVVRAADVGDLKPGARVAVSVDVALPIASFGTYQVVGQVGDSEADRFTLEWQTYPWGLVALNLLGVGLLVWGVRRRYQSRTSPSPLAGTGEEEAGASVIDLVALDQWWKHGKVARAVTPEADDNDSIVDLDAADRWWSRHDSKVS